MSSLILWLDHALCRFRRHPYSCRASVFFEEGKPEKRQTYCNGCGAVLSTTWTDNAGSEASTITRHKRGGE